MKKWKQYCNRKMRRTLKTEEIPDGGAYRLLNDIWMSPSDGKMIFDNEKYRRK